MNEEEIYIPKKGDIVWNDFDHSTETEVQKKHYGVVVSKYDFNRKTMFAIVCPITSTIKKIPTRYTLPEEMEITGQVLISKLTSLDFKERRLKYVDRIPLQDMAKIDQIIEYIF